MKEKLERDAKYRIGKLDLSFYEKCPELWEWVALEFGGVFNNFMHRIDNFRPLLENAKMAIEKKEYLGQILHGYDYRINVGRPICLKMHTRYVPAVETDDYATIYIPNAESVFGSELKFFGADFIKYVGKCRDPYPNSVTYVIGKPNILSEFNSLMNMNQFKIDREHITDFRKYLNV